MAKREVVLDVSGDTFERGAVLISLLAFPEEENLVLSCVHSLCGLFIRAQLHHGLAPAYTKQPVKLAYACWDPKIIERNLGWLTKRLKHRMLAGKMVIPFLQHAQTGKMPDLPPGIRRLSIAQMAEMVLSESGQSEPKNFVSRIWLRSRPVIHLLAATTFVSQALERCGEGRLTVPRILADSAVIDLILRNAEEMVPLLAKSRARVDVDSLIRLRAA
jgi:hypothetical protein